MTMRRFTIRWPRSARQAKGHATLLAMMMWAAAIAVGFIGTSNRGIAGPLKGADFVHFYTLGHLAYEHRVATMYDMAALHDAQVALVPESKPDLYPAVYPPQIPAMFEPVHGWSYQRALFAWNLLTIVAYGFIVWSAWKPVSSVLPDRHLVIAAAAAFPPFWALVLYGQITVLIVGAFWAGWLALERDRHFLAGVAFGLLAIKPQFGLPLAVIVLARRDWPMLAGAIVSVALQSGAAWMMLGSDAFRGFVSTLPITFGNVDLFESKPEFSHSLRVLTRLMPNAIGVPMWIGLVAIVLWYTARVWRSDALIRVRLGTVILAAVLVNPHLIIYDATVLVLPLIWFGAYVQEEPRHAIAPTYWKTVCWLFAALFVPTSAFIGVQVSVLLMAWMLVLIKRAALTSTTSEPALRAA
jgi:hypothetical protein